MGRVFIVTAVLSALCERLAAGGPPPRVDFDHEIRPVLSDRCYSCHGPDEKARKAGFRLDTPDAAFLPRKGGKVALRPGNPSGSELYRRISSPDPAERMPPPESRLALSPTEVERIRLWIDQGAEWKRHWSFLPVAAVDPPQVGDGGWSRNTIDRFILSRLEREGLVPSGEASGERWLRRATYDLTGLPPAIEDVDAFIADRSPDARDRVVDRLLARLAYGERMAAEWLDVARYADTHGYQADRYRATWPWRDWVIKAFAENLPYDSFVTWQVAGDLLESPTKEQRLATAFNRNHMQTEEGGSVEEEFRVTYVVDRTNTFSTAFLGLTLECARCHDHKYDPFTQREYYQLFAFFNNIDESGQTSHFTDSMPVPAMLLGDDAMDAKLAELRHRIREKEAAVRDRRESEHVRFLEWTRGGPRAPAISDLAGHYPFAGLEAGKVENLADPGKPGEAFEDPQFVPGKVGNGLCLSGENGVVLKGVGVFTRADPFTISFWAQAPKLFERAVVIHRSKASLDAGSRGYEVLIEKGRVSVGLHHMWPGNSLKVTSRQALPPGEWVHIAVTYDGSSRASGLKLYLGGQAAQVDVVRDGLTKEILYERVDVDLTVGQRFRDNGFKDGKLDELRVHHRALSDLEVAELSGAGRLSELLRSQPDALEPAAAAGLLDYYLGNESQAYRRALEELRTARLELTRAIDPIPEIMVMQELPRPRPAFLLKRGAYDAPGERVEPGIPAALDRSNERLPPNRLALARWLLDPVNPLAARVAVNRYWQMLFGKGLVATAEDFGSQGALPTHPELLDWLGGRFVASGWDLKRLLKLLVLSSTYCQSSQVRPELLARDPENRLLGRAPSHRLPAEMVRDGALAAAGLLSRRLGGPSVKPYQPEGLWEEKSGARYEPDKGEALYRRSLYTFWKRTSPHPAMITFDAAERNVCIVRRQATSTPLQALVLLNDTQFFEAARKMSERALKEAGPSRDERISFLFRLLMSRRTSEGELEVLRRLYDEQAALYERDPEGARAVARIGDSPADPAVDPVQLATATAVASALLSFDETFTKR